MNTSNNTTNVALEIPRKVFAGLVRELSVPATEDADLAASLAALALDFEGVKTPEKAWGLIHKADILALPILLKNADEEIGRCAKRYPRMDISEMAEAYAAASDNKNPLGGRVQAARRALKLANHAGFLMRDAARADKAAREQKAAAARAARPQRDAARRARQLERMTPGNRPVGRQGETPKLGGGHSKKAAKK